MQDLTQSRVRALRLTTTATDFPSQADEALRRATEPRTPQQPANLLARALADAADTVTNTAGHLTYTTDTGDTITVPVDPFLERVIARAVHEHTMDGRALAALEAGLVAQSVRAPATVTAVGRRPLSLVRTEG